MTQPHHSQSDGGRGHRNAKGRERSGARARGEGNRGQQAPSARRRGTDAPRRVAFEVLQQVAQSDAYANLVLPPALSREQLSGRDAAFATELTYGTLRMLGRYDAVIAQCVDRDLAKIDPPVLDLLRLGAHQVLGMRVPPHAAVSETVGLARSTVGAGSAQFINAILRRITERELPEWLERISEAQSSSIESLSAVESHPQWITRALKESLLAAGRPAAELRELLEANNEAPKVTLVARPGLSEQDELLQVPGSVNGRWTPTAVVLTGRDPGSLIEVREGTAGVQDEGSQLVTLAFVDAPITGTDTKWLDMCAGPGGKAALLGAIAATRGATLVANEVQPHRAALVEKSLQAIDPTAIERIQVWDGREIGDLEPGAYDRILLDAPCTGLGALRRRPESRWRRTVADLTVLTQLQKELLVSALKAVRVGGVVGYVTCSPHLAETRFAVADGIKVFGKDKVEYLDARELVTKIAGPEMELADRVDVQLFSHLHGTDAMHLTLLRRTA
ncbi:transcription antitermination factor NusB [Jonesiaceae bacterium BS-20]|uniref:Transcription antitermination factor NusB n=1 Tax=Jonesiaceae bacterium BS-20 TaxID=3120821 RepID=A0AAU7DYH2_9MICO